MIVVSTCSWLGIGKPKPRPVLNREILAIGKITQGASDDFSGFGQRPR